MGAASTIAVRAVWLLQFKTIRQKKGQNVLCMLADTGERSRWGGGTEGG